MSYLNQKSAPEVDPHNYKVTCNSADRGKYGSEVLAKLEKIQSKIISMKAAQEDVAEIEADYATVKTKSSELKFSTQQGWLKLKKVIEFRFQEIAAKHNKSK